MFDSLMMGLRLVAGIDLNEVTRVTGLDPRRTHAELLARHVRDGLLTLTGARLAPTERGLDLASYVARSFLPD
jgi:oxygen-independent coproporphyrinogen-3 oxidase